MALMNKTNKQKAVPGGADDTRALSDELLDDVAGGVLVVGDELPSPGRPNVYTEEMEKGPGGGKRPGRQKKARAADKVEPLPVRKRYSRWHCGKTRTGLAPRSAARRNRAR